MPAPGGTPYAVLLVVMNAKRPPSSKVKKNAARRHRHELAAGAVGALGGAGMGAIAAGPPGALAGALIGAAAGTLTAWSSEENAVDEAAHDRKLDAEIGVSEGDLGVPGLLHPPAKIGAFSAESAGQGGSAEPPQADGPIPPPLD